MAEEHTKRILITGAGRGIGRAIAIELASRGHALAIASRSKDQLAETAKAVEGAGGSALVVPTDVTDQAAVDRLFQTAVGELDGLDAVVNNAGRFSAIGPTWKVDPQQFWSDIEVNVRGTFLVCRAAVPHFLATGKGTIINMIGGGAASPNPFGNGYGTSKAAVMRFTETLAAELKEHGISVFATNPGLVHTAMTQQFFDTEAGTKWMGHIKDLFKDGIDRPPTDAALLIRRLIEGDYFALTGRRFGPTDDPAEIAKDTERILAEDLRTLRFRE